MSGIRGKGGKGLGKGGAKAFTRRGVNIKRAILKGDKALAKEASS